MNKQGLKRKRERLEEKMNYLCSDKSINDEVFMTFTPAILIAIIIGVFPAAGLTALLCMVGDYDFESAAKIAGCFYVMAMLLVWLLLREWAYSRAAESIKHRRNKVMSALDEVSHQIWRAEQKLN